MANIQLRSLNGLDRNYYLLVLGDFVSKLGSSIFGWSISWYILEITGSSIALGFSLMLTTLPPVLISTIGGTFVDKYSKKIFIVGTDIIRGGLFFLLSYLLFTGNWTLSVVYIFIFAEAIFKAIFRPAVFAALPFIVEKDRIYQAKAFNQAVVSLSNLSAPLLSAILLDKYGILLICFVNAISFCLSAFSEMFIKIEEDEEQLKQKVNISSDLRESFLALSKIKVLFSIVLMLAITNLVASPVSVMLPMALINNTLNLGETAWGVFRTLYIVGTLTGSAFLTFFKTRWTIYQIIFGGMVFLGLIYMGFGLTASYLIILLLSLLNGLLNSAVNVSLSTLTTMLTPKEYLGKFSGLTSALSSISNPFSYIFASILTNLLGVQVVYVIYGAFYMIVVLLIMGRKELRGEAAKTIPV